MNQDDAVTLPAGRQASTTTFLLIYMTKKLRLPGDGCYA